MPGMRCPAVLPHPVGAAPAGAGSAALNSLATSGRYRHWKRPSGIAGDVMRKMYLVLANALEVMLFAGGAALMIYAASVLL